MIIAIMRDENGRVIVRDTDHNEVKASGAVIDLEMEAWFCCQGQGNGSEMKQYKFGEVRTSDESLKTGVLMVLDTCTDDVQEHLQTMIDHALSQDY